jgi:hypothetical protein
MGVKDFLHAPPDSVPDHRFADFLGNGKPESRVPALVRESVNRKQFPPVSRSLTVDPVELRGVGDPRIDASRQGSDGEPLATAPASSRHNPPTADRTHPLAKTVRLRPLATVRLVGSLHFRLLWKCVRFTNSQRVYPSHSRPSSKNHTNYKGQQKQCQTRLC